MLSLRSGLTAARGSPLGKLLCPSRGAHVLGAGLKCSEILGAVAMADSIRTRSEDGRAIREPSQGHQRIDLDQPTPCAASWRDRFGHNRVEIDPPQPATIQARSTHRSAAPS